jgi:hypothetical protein
MTCFATSLRLILRSGPQDRVSKDGAATVPASCFETRPLGAPQHEVDRVCWS